MHYLIVLYLLLTLCSFCYSGPAIIPVQNDEYRFAWLTDTHIGSSGADEDLRKVVKHINQDPDLKFTIISGDVTELDVGNNLALAKEILDELNNPYFIIPGNHDTKWSASGAQTFKNLWGSDRFEFEAGDYRFFGIDQGPLMRMGAGYIAPQNLTWLDSALQAQANPRQPFFIVTHYPIDPSVSNWYELLDIARKYNVQAILHGHGHRNRAADFEGIPGIMSRSSMSRGKGPKDGGFTVVELGSDSVRFFERNLETSNSRIWYSMEITGHGFDPVSEAERPSFDINAEYPQVRTLWQTRLGEMITAAPQTDGFRQVVAVTSTGRVVSMDLDKGTKQWDYQTSGGIHGQALIHARGVIVGSADSMLYCLRRDSGDLLWREKLDGSILNPPVSWRNLVYVAAGEASFHALKVRSGKADWSFRAIDGYVETRPVVTTDEIVFGAWDNSVYSLHPKNGDVNWIWEDGPPGILYSPAACWPVMSNEQILFAAPDRALSAVDRISGETVWRSKQRRVRETIGIDKEAGMAFAKCMWDTVIAFRLDEQNYSEVWASHVGYDFEINPSMLVPGEELLYFTTQRGYVYALDKYTGDIVWAQRLSTGILNTPVLLEDKSLLLTGMDGIVRRIKFEPEN